MMFWRFWKMFSEFSVKNKKTALMKIRAVFDMNKV